GAVISGGVFGDHCSPISDTTIISAMASDCEVIEHTNTQLPYALISGAIAFVLFVVFSFLKLY
ncbi:MAG: Na+/H+ antiporter NhaC family protein, partial [Campylobacterota bacterium]